jgi:hypothetical protein
MKCEVYNNIKETKVSEFYFRSLKPSKPPHLMKHHIRYFGRFPVSQFNDSLGGVDLKCTQWVQFRST